MAAGDAIMLAIGEVITKGVDHESAKRAFGGVPVFKQWQAKPVATEVSEVIVCYNCISCSTGSDV